MQFNLEQMEFDRVLEGSLKYGLAGFAPWIGRDRGMEQNVKYLADGAWNPHLKSMEFYNDYSRRIFGNAALPHMRKAFETLEKNEKFMGWNGFQNFPCCSPPPQLAIAYDLSKQPNPFDGPRTQFSPTYFELVHYDWKMFIGDAHSRIQNYSQSVKYLQEALQYLRAAKPVATPRSQEELTYLVSRTEAYIMHLETLMTWDQAYLDFDKAFQLRAQGRNEEEFVRQLDACLIEFTHARQQGRGLAEKYAKIIDYPSDLGVLYRVNTWMVTGTELVEKFMQNIDNFHHGRDYLAPVDWGRVFTEWPVLNETVWPAV